MPEERSDSDWDILILVPDVKKEIKEEIRDKIYDLELTTDQVISTIIHSYNEWERRAVSPIYQISKDEGIEYEIFQEAVDKVQVG